MPIDIVGLSSQRQPFQSPLICVCVFVWSGFIYLTSSLPFMLEKPKRKYSINAFDWFQVSLCYSLFSLAVFVRIVLAFVKCLIYRLILIESFIVERYSQQRGCALFAYSIVLLIAILESSRYAYKYRYLFTHFTLIDWECERIEKPQK